jgi:hypothetical protein
MGFTFTPMVDAPAESFWTFSIPEQNISVPFLLAGLVAEPRVGLDRPSVNFGQVSRYWIVWKRHMAISAMCTYAHTSTHASNMRPQTHPPLLPL